MADGITPNYGWVKPGISESDDTWGTKWNANLDGIDGVVFDKLARSGGTLTGKLVLKTPDGASASVRFPEGTVPTTPLVGDMWNTVDDLYLRKGSENVRILSSTGPLVDVPWNGHKIPEVGLGVAADDAAIVVQAQTGFNGWAAAVDATPNAIKAVYSPPIVALIDGMTLAVRAKAANTTVNPTFQPDAMAPKLITKLGGLPLLPGDVVGDGHDIVLRYNLAADRWGLLNPPVPPNVVKGDAANIFTATNTFKEDVLFEKVAEVRGQLLAKASARFQGYTQYTNSPLDNAITAVPWDMSLSTRYSLSLIGNRTLSAPTNALDGMTGFLTVIQDATGGRTLTFNAVYKFIDGVVEKVDPAISAITIYQFLVRSATEILMRRWWSTNDMTVPLFTDYNLGLFSQVNNEVVAHGLGRLPTYADVWLKCIAANNGYNVNDRLSMASATHHDRGAFEIAINSTNVYVIKSDHDLYFMHRNTHGVTFNSVEADWEVILRVA